MAFHPRNPHSGSYDFNQLSQAQHELKKYIIRAKSGKDSIDFSIPEAVKSLNAALLKQYYGLSFWDIPKGYLCPPIPGRADYIHHLTDLFNSGKSPVPKLKCLDIGSGANCVYPIIGVSAYDWEFLASEIDPRAFENIQLIVASNPSLRQQVTPRFQKNENQFFKGILDENEIIDLSMCNPPFHESEEKALKGTKRKLKNLNVHKNSGKTTLNFGGQPTELWYSGGEKSFIKQMISESKLYAKQCFWFTTLVSKQENLKPLLKHLNNYSPEMTEVLSMVHGNKTSRILAWTFLDKKAQKIWANARFKT